VGAQQLGGALLADAAHAGDVVGGVSDQRAQVEHLGRRHAEARLDLGRAEAPVAHGVDHVHLLGDQLQQVLVGGGDLDLDALSCGRAHQRGDHVVGLLAGVFDRGEPVGLDDAADPRKLRAQIVGCGVARGLVVGEQLLAPVLGARRVPHDRHVVRRALAQELLQHRGEAEDGVGGNARATGQCGQREERAVDARARVDEEQLLRHRRRS